MAVLTYIFKNVNQQQLRHLFSDFETESNEVHGYFLEFVIAAILDKPDWRNRNEPDDEWSINGTTSKKWASYITYSEMPVGYIVKFLFGEDESEKIIFFINEILDKAKTYGILVEEYPGESLEPDLSLQNNNDLSQTIVKSSKKGPVTYSDDVKLAALKQWDNLPSHTISLQDWLSDKFGLDENNTPNVLEPTFHSWRRKLKNKGLYP